MDDIGHVVSTNICHLRVPPCAWLMRWMSPVARTCMSADAGSAQVVATVQGLQKG